MGLLSSVGNIASGIISGKALGSASKAQQAGLNAARGDINNYYGQSSADIKAQRDYAQNQIANALNTGRSDILGGLDRATQYQKPYAQAGQQSLEELLNGLGIGQVTNNETYGSLAPKFDAEALKTYLDPGYNFQLQQGLNAVNRSNAGQGRYFSGQDLMQSNNYAQQFANSAVTDAYNRYLNNINTRYKQLGGLVDSGQAASNNLSALESEAGTNLAGLGTTISGQANTNALESSKTLADLLTGQGSSLAGIDTGIGGIKSQGILGKAASLTGTIGGLTGSNGNTGALGGLSSDISNFKNAYNSGGFLSALGGLF